jgi:hypothetical protein
MYRPDDAQFGGRKPGVRKGGPVVSLAHFKRILVPRNV